MLKVDGVVAGYGRSRVLKGVDVSVSAGERVVLLGRNGMGKTTLAKAIVGLLPTWAGSIDLGGKTVERWPAYRRVWDGLGYVPQGRGLFPGLSVEENLRVGLHGTRPRGKEVPQLVYDYFPVLYERRKQVAGTLSGGEQQQLAIGRALVGNPSVMVLDEPSEGIQPNLVTGIIDRLIALAREGDIALLLIEQNIDAAAHFAERCLFMENGNIVHACPVEGLGDTTLVDRLLGV
jgi:urea transport system ATP-binding protein